MRKFISACVVVVALAGCATGSFGARWFSTINTSKLRVGMTQQEVTDNTPLSKHVNRTVVGNVVHEQWIFTNAYSGKTAYLYLENGVLVGWQD